MTGSADRRAAAVGRRLAEEWGVDPDDDEAMAAIRETLAYRGAVLTGEVEAALGSVWAPWAARFGRWLDWINRKVSR